MKRNFMFMCMALIFATFVSSGQDIKKAFYGMWTLEIEGGGVGWLHVYDNNGYLDAELLWRGGSVVPVSGVWFADNNNLMVTRVREIVRSKAGDPERKHLVTQLFEIERSGDKLEGVMTDPSRDGFSAAKSKFKGWKLPDPGLAPDLTKIKYGTPIELFNGKDLTGWRLIDPKQANGFKVIDGALVNDPVNKEGQRINFGNLRTEKEYEDFKLTLEVNVPAHSNSGVYLRGMYEIQVLDSYGKPLDSHNMGGLYSRINPSQPAEKPAGEWQSMEIVLCERHVTVVLNGKTIIDNKPAYGPTGGAIIADVFKPGPIYLQGDHGKVSYRNLVLTPIIK
jgi:hypothetical protein